VLIEDIETSLIRAPFSVFSFSGVRTEIPLREVASPPDSQDYG
jgi:hypothetical protein